MTIPQAFTLALQHHQAGRLRDAEALYRQILAAQPNHAETRHHFGVLAGQSGRHDVAVEQIRQALILNPNNPAAHSNLGESYRQTGQFDEAVASYRRAIALKPDLVMAHYNLGNLFHERRQFDEAIAAYRRALQLQPDWPEPHNNLANTFREKGQLDEAVAMYRRAIQLRPDYPEAHNNLGIALAEKGQLEAAVSAYRRALQLRPDDPEAHHHLGVALAEQGRLDEAMIAYRRALQLRPDYPEAHDSLGRALKDRGDFAAAIASHRRALELRPDSPETYHHLGIALAKDGRLDEAVAAYRQALHLRPGDPEAQSNLGHALREQDQLNEAIAAYRRALELRPDFAEVHNNLADALTDIGQLDEAMVACRRALELQPDYGPAKLNHSLLLLLRGDFQTAWPWYEARWDSAPAVERSFYQPRWDGSPLEGQRVLVHSEQGFGDSIQFVRYAQLIAERGGKVIVECQRPLVELFRNAPGVSEVVAAGDSLPPFDLHVPMLSQPLVFKTTRETIPRDVPYLFADPARCATWRERLGGDRSRLKVGLAWAGTALHVRLRKRHIPLRKLLPLLDMDGVGFFSLQMDGGTEQIGQLPAASGIIDHTAHIHDFADTAAFMSELDLIISVDTAVAHLAGALGRPVWTLLSFVPDWRWGLEGGETPWYPTAQLFRQSAGRDWEPVMERVAVELERLKSDRG